MLSEMINNKMLTFQHNRSVRNYLRFILETCLIFAVYLLWLSVVHESSGLNTWFHFLNGVIWCLGYRVLGLHTDRLRYSSLKSYTRILNMTVLLSSLLAIESLVVMSKLDVIALLLFALLSLNSLVGMRLFIRQFIRKKAFAHRVNILIYGTSDVAIDLANAMAFGEKYNVVGFISEDTNTFGMLSALPVIRFKEVENFARANDCHLVVIAGESPNFSLPSETLLKLDKLGLSVSYAPTLDRAFDYEVKLKAVKPEELLGRTSEIDFDENIDAELNNKTVLVTGAGGSIGSEVCRQILRYQPVKMLLLELNELALYKLEQEISGLVAEAKTNIQVQYYLGSVTDETILTKIFREQKVDIVYHAAAYKHVPIVEENVIAGITNNVFGTKCVAEIADRFGADKFVLVSTDKAVRPTNVMGASKRLAELVLQDLSKSSETIFTMVRFGNVLGSSGSVIPKFKAQIDAGGPITVTHEEITRYFMSIPEAAHLVLNASAFANGGDVFLLDMGVPVKILELAKSMVRQHGLKPVLSSGLKSRQKFDNEILIEFSGLRPGEKLYEELLIDGVVQATQNPKIFKSMDGVSENLDLTQPLKLLANNIQENRIEAVKDQLRELPLSYQPNGNLMHDQASVEKDNRIKLDRVQGREKNAAVESFLENWDHPSFLKRLFSFKPFLALIHKYFLVRRGLTLGVRVLVENNQGEVLLVNHSYIKGLYLPGGGVDIGEDIEHAARREIREETGITGLVKLTFLGVDFNESVSKRDHVVYFKAYANTGVLPKRSAEILDAQFVPKKKLENVLDPVQWQFIQDKL